MAHVRKQIRAAVLAALGGVNALGGRVYLASRITDPGAGGTPEARVLVSGEAAEPVTTGPKYNRDVAVGVSVWLAAEGVAEGEELEDDLDDLGAAIEVALLTDAALRDLSWRRPVYGGSEIDISTSEDRPVGRLDMSFTVSTVTAVNDPETVEI